MKAFTYKYGKRILLDGMGLFLFVVGVAGLFLPLIQGALFMMLGLYILSYNYEFAHRGLHRAKRIHPRVHSTVDAFDLRFKKFFNIE